MKKKTILATALAVLGLGITSCDMNLEPEGTLGLNNSLQTLSDAQNFRTGFYTALNGRVDGARVYYPEIQSDIFHATTGFGNRGGGMYEWTFITSDGDIQALYQNPYSAIKDLNFFIAGANSMDKTDFTADELAQLQVWKGEAFFLRAYYHMMLAELFCQDPVGNEDTYGVPYVTVYNPTSDQTQYPSRGTLGETYSMIFQDLDSAAAYITTPGEAGSEYVTADAVLALRARAALYTGDYQTAISSARTLVDSGTYPLVDNAADFHEMWRNDSGAECILQLWGDLQYNSNTYDYTYIGYNVSEKIYAPDYIPEQWVLDLYDSNDLRWGQFFKDTVMTMTGGAEYPVTLLYKFAGNPEMKTGNEFNCEHKAKPFRIAETYLILAEAYARNGQAAEGSAVLNELRAARIPGYTEVAYGQSQLLTEVLQERVRELIGEGFRLQDLRRYDMGFSRDNGQVDVSALARNYNLSRTATDPRFVWPIPQEELLSNPQMAGQQNPGY